MLNAIASSKSDGDSVGVPDLTSRVVGVASRTTQVFGRSFLRLEAGDSRTCGCSVWAGGCGAGLLSTWRAGAGNGPAAGFAGVAAVRGTAPHTSAGFLLVAQPVSRRIPRSRPANHGFLRGISGFFQAQECRHVEILALDDRRLDLFEPSARDRFELEGFLFDFRRDRFGSEGGHG